jgi:predicted acylesterase/phospholipase RssA
MTKTLQEAERQARDIIRGRSTTPKEVLELEKALRAHRKFGLARKVLERGKDHSDLMGDAVLRLKIAQKRSFCTYKDPDLPTDQKLEDALQILREAEDLKTTTDQETLGLAGAIYKRTWEWTAQERHLETSLAYYFRGYQEGVAKDYGYTGINAAFILDVLADLEGVEAQPGPVMASTAAQRRSLARDIRKNIVTSLPMLLEQPGNASLNRTWSFLVTVGDAYFGLDDFDNAESWLMRAAALLNAPDLPSDLNVSDWEQETTARQLAALLRMKENGASRDGLKIPERARDVLRNFLGQNAAAMDSAVRGKVGVALSGGGFRASLYHIGVLAKLAELDLLRHVEYLSCVSGGSIIGAHFYLEVRKLLQEKSDAEITRDDYIKIVQRIETDFLQGVKTNIRTQIAAEWLTNIKLIFLSAYSRTKRAGELYEREIYSKVADGDGNRERWLDTLKVEPKGEPAGFSPKDHNWRRFAKVPILVLNATTLNTGHNWQFTATWMGEPPADINSEIDANYRLRRMYYTEAPSPHNRIRLGYAVAASACVPGIFEPLTLTDLYERSTEDRKVRPVVRLVDGGVYDNQGVAALLEQGCSVLLVSDASGQMDARDFPSNGLLGVPLRANSILQARVRVSQFGELSSRRRGGLLKGLMFVHLKTGLETTSVDWIDSQEPSPPATVDPLVPYGVQRHVQRQLASIRTDLDSFSEVEADALMTSGYLMTEHALKDSILGFPIKQRARETWKFLNIEPLMTQGGQGTPLVRQLKVANYLFFKVWLLMRKLQVLGGVLAVLLLSLFAYAAYNWWEGEIFTLTVKDVVLAVSVGVLVLFGLGSVGKIVNYRKTATEILIGIGMATFGFLLARLHLHVFDKLFLWQGTLQRLLVKEKPDARSATGGDAAELV